jgi:hypothetical protein
MHTARYDIPLSSLTPPSYYYARRPCVIEDLKHSYLVPFHQGPERTLIGYRALPVRC